MQISAVQVPAAYV